MLQCCDLHTRYSSSNCSNNYGPFHFPEKLIPVIILNALAGKALWLAVTAGGPVNSFREEGISRRPLSDYLLPFEQSAALCDMRYLEPFAVYRIRKLTKPYLQERAEEYRAALLQHLRDLSNRPSQENADA